MKSHTSNCEKTQYDNGEVLGRLKEWSIALRKGRFQNGDPEALPGMELVNSPVPSGENPSSNHKPYRNWIR